MTTIILRSVQCLETSGGPIKFSVGSQDLIPFTPFVAGAPPTVYPIPPATVPPFIDLGILPAAIINLDLHDQMVVNEGSIEFSSNSIASAPINTGTTLPPPPLPSQEIEYSKRVQIGETRVRVFGNYMITYEITQVPIVEPTAVYVIRIGGLILQAIQFTFLFLRDLVLSIAVPIIRQFSRFSRGNDQSNLK